MTRLLKEWDPVSRRSFLRGAGLIGLTAAAGGTLAACAGEPSSSSDSSDSSDDYSGAFEICKPHDFWAASAAVKDPIAEEDISETIDCDVCVVGAGMSGVNAAWAAAQAGSSVVVLQKDSSAFTHGGGIGAYGTTLQKALGEEADWDVEEAINRWMRESEYRSDRKLVHRWAEFSGMVLDRICMAIEQDTSEGLEPYYMFDPAYGTEYPDSWNYAYSGGIVMGANDPDETESDGIGHMERIAEIILNRAVDEGAQVYFNTPGVQLIQDDSGAVTGVIGLKEDDTYIRVNTANGVVLAAGDYGHNTEMKDLLMPHIKGMAVCYTKETNTGDGQLMGMNLGAQLQLAPHAGNMHYDPGVSPAYNIGGSGCPWLFVNTEGNRFCNEDASYGQLYAQDMNQPDLIHYQVFDSNYVEQVQAGAMGEGNQKNGPFIGFGMEWIDGDIEAGRVYQGETIEELAEAMGVPADNLEATVARYNELYEMGEDVDFGKQAARLTPINTPPYYAILRQATLLCALGGLVINENMEVIDTERNVIPGLWACGNNSGNWFGGLEHPMVIPGMSLGRASTTGYLAGMAASGATIDELPTVDEEAVAVLEQAIEENKSAIYPLLES